MLTATFRPARNAPGDLLPAIRRVQQSQFRLDRHLPPWASDDVAEQILMVGVPQFSQVAPGSEQVHLQEQGRIMPELALKVAAEGAEAMAGRLLTGKLDDS